MLKQLSATLLLAAGWALAAPPPAILNEQGQADWRDYVEAPDHRAFAIAPGGAWGWAFSQPTRAAAESGALAACTENTAQKCVLYAADDETVFDAARWPTLWGPYLGAAKAKRAPAGKALGQRFPNLAFADAAGASRQLADYAGKTVVLHFWGSWCGPCRKEMPELQALYDSLRDRREIVFILLQGREKFAVAQRWMTGQGLHLPLHDAGSAGDDDAFFRTADGTKIPDRQLATGYPSTYVLDRNGIVVFAHVRSVYAWPQYRDFLLDVAARSR